MPKTCEKDLQIAQLKEALLQSKMNLQATEFKYREDQQKLERIQKKLDHVTKEYDVLLHAFLNAQRQAFGKKSERFIDDTPNQQRLFEPDDLDKAHLKEPDAQKHTEDITYTRKKKKRKEPDWDALPQREEIIPVSESDRMCRCGSEKEVIRYETKRLLNHIPATLEVVHQKREVVACRKGCDNCMTTAKASAHILPKCRASHSLLAHIAVSKILDRQPLYHLEKKIEREHGFRIPRATMSRWLIQLSEKLQPLINLMKEELLDYDVAYIDATSFQVLNEPHRKPESKGQAYCIRGGPPDKRIILYEYNGYTEEHRNSENRFVKDYLEGFEGVLHCDASPVFDTIAEKQEITLSYCHAHARRKFEAIEKLRKSGKTKRSPDLAHYVMTQVYKPLYAIERKMKEDNLSYDQIVDYRQKHSKPILDHWYDCLKQNKEDTFEKTPIGKAIRYVLNHWEGLNTYLTDGRLEIDNNATERDIKPFVIGRKNFLFACTTAGADALGVHFSLIMTAKAHGLCPVTYYNKVLDRLADAEKHISNTGLFDLENQLLPWNIKL